MLTFTFFSIPVSADNGPKPSVILTIDDPPDEEYYVDLLYFYDDNNNYQYQGNAKVENFAKINCDLEMVKLLLSVKENTENYHFCRLYFADSGLIWKSTPEYQSSENQYEFVRSALRPQMDNFKIVMVTKSKKLYISDMIHKTAFYSEITCNPEANQWHESHLLDI